MRSIRPKGEDVAMVADAAVCTVHGTEHRAARHHVAGLARVLVRRAVAEIAVLMPSRHVAAGSWGVARTGCANALAHGVQMRVIHDHDPHGVTNPIAALASAGVEVRRAARIPRALLVVDRSVALLSQDAEGREGVLVQDPALVEMLSALFADLWARAVPDPAAQDPAQRDRDRAVLHMLSRGLTDQSAARWLGVSTRTYRRWVADLMARLGASSRFQAGVLATDRGWLAEVPGPAQTGAAIPT